ncbi:uncharacterized protein LOC132736072 isoform X3 [Ruditapes philippinarum]|nr:uncharacterized protein LOC132736072 isoform X3 [Ruditapes philippinarum]XP_060579136.1 uncharacterized protein LOC132736072 isoform X3 [Ruditapes philippinarum]XP_060579145.1 uncharacterized protein LOC132736072 isoform X3 [Ruditapes philippinarum]
MAAPLPKPHYSTPYNNYLSGDGKSLVYEGPGYYVPSERGRWIQYSDYRSLPREARRDAIDMQSEDQFVNFMRQRDTPSGYYHKNIGLKQSGVPALRLAGYTRQLPSMPSKDIFQNPWPKSDAWVPIKREGRGEYYGYYHEAIDGERDRRRKEFPTSWRIEPRDVPKL